MHEIVEYLETSLDRDTATRIATLSSRSFDDSTRSLEERVAEMLEAACSDDPEKTSGRRFVIWDGGQAIAHARTFVRNIYIGDQEIPEDNQEATTLTYREGMTFVDGSTHYTFEDGSGPSPTLRMDAAYGYTVMGRR